ncbi:MAG: AAA family ATPase [Acidobacteriota bacterium]
MIERLTALELTDFRGWRGAHGVPLDADVVLLHGANGAGKSSLLAALELGLTGAVGDLAGFVDDYPRCLRHVGAAEARVTLRWRSGEGESSVERTVGGAVETAGGAELDPALGRRFVERCYLSQARLSRLLEVYQTPDAGREQPILRMLGAMLGFGPVDALMEGLHPAGDLRVLRKASPAVARLDAEERRLDADRRGWEQRCARLEEDWRRARREVEAVDRQLDGSRNAFGEPDWGEDEDPLVDAVRTRIAALRPEEELEETETGLQGVHRIRGILETLEALGVDRLAEDSELGRAATALLRREAQRLGVEGRSLAETHGVLSEAVVDEARRWSDARGDAVRRLRWVQRAEGALVRLTETRLRLAESQRRRADFAAKSRELESARVRVDGVVSAARRLRGAAAEAQAEMVSRLLDERLNERWGDLFGRLAPAERFRPKLGAPRVRRGRLRASARATSDGAEGFDRLGAVLSSGNLNTAALTLFVALHFMERSQPPVLVIDDPVQAMDDVHTVQLAALLRSIVYDGGRQLILAVHDRALFDYLTLELGPTTSGHSLLALGVRRGEDGPSLDVRQRVWRDDGVRFGD